MTHKMCAVAHNWHPHYFVVTKKDVISPDPKAFARGLHLPFPKLLLIPAYSKCVMR